MAKKYKGSKTIIHYAAVVVGKISGTLSAGSFASGLTGIGIIISVPLGVIASVFGFASAGLTSACKKTRA